MFAGCERRSVTWRRRYPRELSHGKHTEKNVFRWPIRDAFHVDLGEGLQVGITDLDEPKDSEAMIGNDNIIGRERAQYEWVAKMERCEVLVVEDNGADRFWLEYVLQSLGVSCAVSAVTDGEQAVDFLLKQGPYAQAPTPDAIFLDAHLPKLDGLEVLRKVPNAQALPICVLTSSDAERTAFKEEFGITDSNYLLKPVSQAGIVRSSCFRDHLDPTAKH